MKYKFKYLDQQHLSVFRSMAAAVQTVFSAQYVSLWLN